MKYFKANDPLHMGNIIENLPQDLVLYCLGACVLAFIIPIVFFKSVKQKKLKRILEAVFLFILLLSPIFIIFNEGFQDKLNNKAMSYEVSVFITYFGFLGIIAFVYFLSKMLLCLFSNVETQKEKQDKRIKAERDRVRIIKARKMEEMNANIENKGSKK